MREYRQRQGLPQHEASIHRSQLAIERQTVSVLPHANAEGRSIGAGTSAAMGFAQDFSQVPLYSNTSAGLQAKLSVNSPGDIYEQEADRASERVISMAEPQVQRACACGGECPNCKDAPAVHEHMQAKRVQAHDTGEVEAPRSVREVLGSPGQPLDPSARAFMEPRFGYDFSGVRVHTDARAALAASSIGARAFTVNRDIVFGAGGYAPNSGAGRQLLAHELAHVVQQSGGAHQLSRSPAVVQRRIGDGHDLSSPWLAGDARLEGAFDNESGQFLRRGSRGTAVKRVQQLLFFLGFDIGPHGADGIFGADTEAAVRAFQAIFASPVDGIVGPITIGALDSQAGRPEPNRTTPGPVPAGPPTGRPPSVSVDRIDLVDGAAGAIGGFPAIVGGASLNTPGPFNSPTEVKNSLQVHFHVDNGSSADLTPVREIQRTATMAGGTVLNNPPDQVLPPGAAGPPAPGGFTGVLIANDGPAAHEIQRPDAHTIVVADAPGLQGLVPANYPITYRAHFTLTMNDARNAPIARANFDVLIDKRTQTEVPNTENRAVIVAKKDFVRGKNL